MSNVYNNPEEVLENPGLFCFRIDNQTNSFVFGNKKHNISERDAQEIKKSILEVFQKIQEEIKRYEYSNPEYLGHIFHNLEKGYSNKKKLNFPGLQVINIDREKLNYFTHWPERFLLCEKTDGVRYLLIQFKNGKCFLVGRNLEFFEINIPERLPPPPSFMKINNEWNIEYLLDGELVLDNANEEDDEKSKIIEVGGKKKKINFLIFDAVIIKCLNYGHLPFKQRLDKFSRIFNEEYELSKYINSRGKLFLEKYNIDIQKSKFLSKSKLIKEINSTGLSSKTNSNLNKKIITLYIKDYYTFDQVEKLNNFIQMLPHHNDGLIINVDDYPYYSGQSCEIFKWKPLEMNTIDFEIIYNEKIKKYILYITTKEGNLPVEILSFASNEEKENFSKIYIKNGNKHIGECYYDSKLINDEVAMNNYNIRKIKNENNEDISDIFSSYEKKIPKDKEKYKGGWRFQKFRNDKLYSNFINTYQNIKICIKEDIQMSEIIKAVKENGKVKLPDLDEEKNFMSALIWKKFFKKVKNEEEFEDNDELFFEEKKDENKNQFLNKKRQSPNKIEEEFNDEDNKDYNDSDIDKIYDDDDEYE